MRLLADENIAAPLVQMLRRQGFDVGYIAELQPGLSDDGVMADGHLGWFPRNALGVREGSARSGSQRT